MENPNAGKPLKYTLSKYRSIRIKEKYRLLYHVREETKEVILIAFGHRKDIYKWLVLHSQ